MQKSSKKAHNFAVSCTSLSGRKRKSRNRAFLGLFRFLISIKDAVAAGATAAFSKAAKAAKAEWPKCISIEIGALKGPMEGL